MDGELVMVGVEELDEDGRSSPMKMASISETRNNLGALIDEVKGGEVVLVTDRGKPVAQIVAASGLEASPGRVERLERVGALRRGSGKAVLDGPPINVKGSVLQVLLDERRKGR
jgi:prevent-host-death family protein